MRDLKALIRDIPDFPKAGILFRDITPLLLDAPAFRDTVERLCALRLLLLVRLGRLVRVVAAPEPGQRFWQVEQQTIERRH